MIELALVLLIVSIAAAAVVLHLEGPLRQAQMRDVVGMVAGFDRLAREHARASGRPLRLVVDLSGGQLSRREAQGSRVLGSPASLPPEYQISRVVVRGRDAGSSQATIPCSVHGLTPTYALLIEGPSDRKQWLLFAGLTGEMVQVDEDGEINTLFAATGARDNPR